jgi:hypothetical protein
VDKLVTFPATPKTALNRKARKEEIAECAEGFDFLRELRVPLANSAV